MYKQTYVVRTRDVDGCTSRTYTTLAGARKRFESMLGYTLENAAAEQYVNVDQALKDLALGYIVVRGVSMFGTVVSIRGLSIMADPNHNHIVAA